MDEYDEGKFAEGVAFFHQLAGLATPLTSRNAPIAVDAYNGLAIGYSHLAKWPQEREYLEKGLALFRTHPQYLTSQGASLFQRE